MRILLTGASGFIGRHLLPALRAHGHEVLEARRTVRDSASQVAIDFTRATAPSDWTVKLQQVDCVINAVGILRERGTQSFDRIHTQAPCALFEACERAGVQRVIQISALGADAGASGYFRSKHLADEALAHSRLKWTIVQPSLVYGPGGTSARLFSLLASLPFVPLPGSGEQRVQPIHIDDAVEALIATLSDAATYRERIALVGAQALSLKDFLARLRTSLGLGKALFVPIPMWLMKLSASIAQLHPHSLLDRETLSMLEAGNTADSSRTRELLGRSPRPAETFVEPRYRNTSAQSARLIWLMPLMRFALASVWIWTGIVSFGIYPTETSYQLLYRVGVPLSLGPIMLYGAATLDLLFGIATLFLPKRRLLYLLQMILIAGYTFIITIKLPEFWLHPYGPLSKNLPMLVGIYWLYVLEERGERL
jgi:uncharacterized protein YbjT (DUF2867 family)